MRGGTERFSVSRLAAEYKERSVPLIGLDGRNGAIVSSSAVRAERPSAMDGR
ncbi:MAG: hypothetical protein WCT14_10950 [Treponemataceae bacterium]